MARAVDHWLERVRRLTVLAGARRRAEGHYAVFDQVVLTKRAWVLCGEAYDPLARAPGGSSAGQPPLVGRWSRPGPHATSLS